MLLSPQQTLGQQGGGKGDSSGQPHGGQYFHGGGAARLLAQHGAGGGDQLERGSIQYHEGHHGIAGDRRVWVSLLQLPHSGKPQRGGGIPQPQQISG